MHQSTECHIQEDFSLHLLHCQDVDAVSEVHCETNSMAFDMPVAAT